MKRIFSAILTAILFATCFNVAVLADTSTYKLYGEDFQNETTGFDTSKWKITTEKNFEDISDYSAEFNIVNDPVAANEGNNVLQVGGETATLVFSSRKETSDYPNALFKLDGKFSLEFDIYFPASQQKKNFKFINGYDHSGSSAVSFLGGQFLNFVYQPNNSNWRLLVRQNPGGETYTESSFNADTWYKIRLAFDFSTHTYRVWINGRAEQKSSGGGAYAFDFSSSAATRFDRISFPALAGQTYYLDNIKAYQNVCADANVQGFYNEAGTKIEAVDPAKTVFKTTLINRTNAAVNTNLILVALNEAETKLKDVRLISFADANSEKVVEETFSNLGAGVKIKAIYLDGLTALAPETIDSTLKTFEIPAAAAAEAE